MSVAAKIFLLSPANCAGKRASLLLRDEAPFPFGVRLRQDGAPIGEVFAFVSGLYFRGKLAYATAFSSPPPGAPGILVITPNRGLIPAAAPIDLAVLRDFGAVDIDPRDSRYRDPLERDAARLAETAGDGCEFVFLGSLATGKYLSLLCPIFGERLRVPQEFIGLGDMKRGSLALKCAEAGRELDYVDASRCAVAIRR